MAVRVPEDYATVQAAVAAAGPGGTVLIARGVWSQDEIVLRHPVNLKGDTTDPVYAPVVLRNAALASGAYPYRGIVRLDFEAAPAPGEMIWEGLTLDLYGEYGPDILVGPICPWAAGLIWRIHRCRFTNPRALGIFAGNPDTGGYNTYTAAQIAATHCSTPNARSGVSNWGMWAGFNHPDSRATVGAHEGDGDAYARCHGAFLAGLDDEPSPAPAGYGPEYGTMLYPWDPAGELRGTVTGQPPGEPLLVRIYRADREEWIKSVLTDAQTGAWTASGLDPTVEHYAVIFPPASSGLRPWAEGPGYPRVP